MARAVVGGGEQPQGGVDEERHPAGEGERDRADPEQHRIDVEVAPEAAAHAADETVVAAAQEAARAGNLLCCLFGLL